jgi:hypothetical protein
MRSRLMLAAAVLAAFGATGVQAQSCADETHCSTTLSATLLPVVEFTGIAGTFDFGNLGLAAYNAGTAATTGAVTLTHHGNVPYTVTVNAEADALGFVPSNGDADPTKPVSDVTIHQTTGGAPADVDLAGPGSPATLYQRLNRGGDLTTSMTADMALSYANDPPGAYTSTIYFTIAAD